jgi:hypothetical protein
MEILSNNFDARPNHEFSSFEKKYRRPLKGLIPRALFLGEMRNISPVSFEL